jgi:bifunctional DNA-binding transcriptional regulator/antitoxin component of YhaV-PrlF toxin-antitoxin module
MGDSVRVRKDGSIVLPARLREQYGVRPGALLRVVAVDGALIVAPVTTEPPAASDALACSEAEEGLDMAQWQESLRQQRERYYAEKYGGSGR